MAKKTGNQILVIQEFKTHSIEFLSYEYVKSENKKDDTKYWIPEIPKDAKTSEDISEFGLLGTETAPLKARA